MRILLVSGSRWLRTVLNQCLEKYGLIASEVELDNAFDADERPLVVLHSSLWNAEAQTYLRYLVDNRAVVFFVCREATRSSLVRIALELGAAEVATTDRDALEVLAIKISRHVQQRQALECPLGTRLFDVLEGCLFAEGRRIDLAATEWRLLRRLCIVNAADHGARLTTAQLAQELREQDATLISRESSVRNYITKLRRKLEEDAEHPRVLLHDAGGYYLVLDPSGRPPERMRNRSAHGLMLRK